MNYLARLGVSLLEYLLGDAIAWASKKYAEYKAKKAIDDAAQRSVKKLEDAKTGKEVDDAADDALGGV
jgi:hypothetical protein